MGVAGILHTGLSVSDLDGADNGWNSGAKAVYAIGLELAEPSRRS